VVIAQFNALPQAVGAWSIVPEDFFGSVVQALRE